MIDPMATPLQQQYRQERPPVEATVTQVDDNRAVAVVERRDPQAATGAAQYINPLLPMIAEWDAEAAIRMGMLANVYVYRCLRIRAQAIAGRPFRAGRDADKPGEWNKEAPLARLLGPPPYGPNLYVSSRRLWAYSAAQFGATGRFAWEIELDPRTKKPVALWPLVSSLLRPVPTDGGAAWWKSFKYGVGGKEKTLTPDRVFYEWRPSATDYRQPESVLQSARLTVSTAVMLERYAYGFLMNDARPATVIVSEAFGSQEEREAWRSQFLASHRGPGNAGKPIFTEVEGGGEKGVLSSLEIKTLGLSQTDAQMIQQAEHCIKGICAAFGTPLSKVSNSTDTTFANTRQDDINWWRDEMLPEMVELQDAVNMQLAPRLGTEVGWFDISDVPQLRSSKLLDLGRALAPLIDNGTILRDEVRQEVDLPALPDGVGAVPTAAVAMTSLKSAETGQAAALPVAAPPSPTGAIPNAPKLEPAPTAAPARQVPPPGLARGHERGDDERPVAPARVRSTRDQRAAEWRRANAQVRTLEGAWRVAFGHLFAEQRSTTLAKLKGQRRRLRQAGRRDDPPIPSADSIFDAAAWAARTSETAGSLYAQTVAVGAARAGAKFDHTLDVTAKGPKAFIDARANKLAGQVTDTTYGQIKDALKAGVDAGEGIDDIATRVADVFDAADTVRAELIARTETISAYNGSAVLVAEDLGADVVGGQEWIATVDDRTREDHADADGQQVRMGEMFQVGGDELAYPGDPDGPADQVCACRCTTGLLTPDELDDTARLARLSEARRRRADRVGQLAVAWEYARMTEEVA